MWYAGRPIQLGITSVLAAVWKDVTASLLAVCVTAVIMEKLSVFVAAPDSIGALEHIAKISFLFGALYIGAVIVLHRGCAPLIQVIGLLREMVPGGKSSKRSPAVARTCGAGTGKELSLTGD
jgi:hypothetical protein